MILYYNLFGLFDSFSDTPDSRTVNLQASLSRVTSMTARRSRAVTLQR